MYGNRIVLELPAIHPHAQLQATRKRIVQVWVRVLCTVLLYMI